MDNDLTPCNGMYPEIEFIPSEGRGLLILQPPHDFKPDESGLQEALLHAIWSIHTSKSCTRAHQYK